MKNTMTKADGVQNRKLKFLPVIGSRPCCKWQ